MHPQRLQNPSYQLTADDVDELSSAKIDLSSKGKNDAVTFQLAALEDETLTITNEMLADMCEAEMDALLQVMAKVTDVLLMEEVQVQRVLYVGGSSHLVMVQDLTRSYLSDMFPGVEFVIPAHRDLAVAEGAALYALSDSEISGSRLAISMPKVVDVTTRDIGVRICEDGDDDVMRVIVPRYSEFRQRGAGSCDFFNVGEGNRILFQVRCFAVGCAGKDACICLLWCGHVRMCQNAWLLCCTLDSALPRLAGPQSPVTARNGKACPCEMQQSVTLVPALLSVHPTGV